MTLQAYKAITLQMSTGDFHTHRKNEVKLTSVKGDERYKIIHYWEGHYNPEFDDEYNEEVCWDLISISTIKGWIDYPPYLEKTPKLRLISK